MICPTDWSVARSSRPDFALVTIPRRLLRWTTFTRKLPTVTSYNVLTYSSYVYNDAEGSFKDIDTAYLPQDNVNPPENCPVHLRAEEVAQRNTPVPISEGIVYHSDQYHAGDFCLVNSDQGPANLAQILEIDISSKARDRGKTNFIVRMLGRISDIAHLNSIHTFKEEVSAMRKLLNSVTCLTLMCL